MADGSRPKMNVGDPIRDEPAPGLAHEEKGSKEGPTSFSEDPRPRDGGSRALVSWLRERVAGHENAALGGACGLAVALLVFSIGVLRRPVRGHRCRNRAGLRRQSQGYQDRAQDLLGQPLVSGLVVFKNEHLHLQKGD